MIHGIRSYPLGRLLIDLPRNAVLAYELVKFLDEPLEYLPSASRQSILKDTEELTATLQSTLHKEFEGQTLYIDTFDLPHHGKAVLGWPHPYATSLATLSCQLMTAEGRFFSWKPAVNPEYFSRAQTVLSGFAQHLHSFELDQPYPAVPAFCFSKGSYQQPMHSTEEYLSVIFSLSDGFSLECKTRAGSEPDDLFEILGSDFIAESQREGIRVFRFAERTVNTFSAQEVCIAEPSESGGTNMEYYFQLNIVEDVSQAFPGISLNMFMESARIPKKFPSVEQALFLWDSIVSSLRLRPSAL